MTRDPRHDVTDSIESCAVQRRSSMRTESVRAFALQSFEFGVDPDGHGLVMRLIHKQDGARHQTTYALDFEQNVRFATELVKALEQAEKLWDRSKTRQ